MHICLEQPRQLVSVPNKCTAMLPKSLDIKICPLHLGPTHISSDRFTRKTSCVGPEVGLIIKLSLLGTYM